MGSAFAASDPAITSGVPDRFSPFLTERHVAPSLSVVQQQPRGILQSKRLRVPAGDMRAGPGAIRVYKGMLGRGSLIAPRNTIWTCTFTADFLIFYRDENCSTNANGAIHTCMTGNSSSQFNSRFSASFGNCEKCPIQFRFEKVYHFSSLSAPCDCMCLSHI